MGATLLPSSLPTERVVETIRLAIAPFVGDTMARASTEALGRKLGVGAPFMTDHQALALVEKVSQGLNVFIGRDRAGQVQGEILRALNDGGRA